MTLSAAEMQEAVSDVWRELLPGAGDDPDANFFDAGGTSILAARLAGRLQLRIGSPISANDILQFPTLRVFCWHLAGAAGPSLPNLTSPRALNQRRAFQQLRGARMQAATGDAR